VGHVRRGLLRLRSAREVLRDRLAVRERRLRVLLVELRARRELHVRLADGEARLEAVLAGGEVLQEPLEVRGGGEVLPLRHVRPPEEDARLRGARIAEVLLREDLEERD